MQTLLLPAATSGTFSSAAASLPRTQPQLRRVINHHQYPLSSSSSIQNTFPNLKPHQSKLNPFRSLSSRTRELNPLFSASNSYGSTSRNDDEARLAQVAKRLDSTSRYFKRLGSLGFWGQLVCTIVSAVILSFSVVITGKVSSPATFYSTAGGIAAAFISVFYSYGYIKLSEALRRTAKDPSKAPPRAEVVKGLKNGIVLNLLGMGAAILGMQATVGLLVAKALTTSTSPFYQGISPGYSPVLALDVFLVQASANTILSHFLGLVCSLELLRSVTTVPADGVPIPRAA